MSETEVQHAPEAPEGFPYGPLKCSSIEEVAYVLEIEDIEKFKECDSGSPPEEWRINPDDFKLPYALKVAAPALLSACEAALECIARLTPLPCGDGCIDKAIEETADYADETRDTLRDAIKKTKPVCFARSEGKADG